jgi:hypothetical protein
VSLLLLEGDLLVDLVGVPVTSSWKIVKGPGLLLRGACKVVVELAISKVMENISIRKELLSFVELAQKVWYQSCLKYLYLSYHLWYIYLMLSCLA